MADYSFTTHWKFKAERQRVWDELNAPLQWPQWWKGLESVVELNPGNKYGIGCLREYTWRSFLPYTLTFKMLTTKIEPMTMIEGVASGDVEGIGLWTFSESGDYTLVRYFWNVRTTGTLMNMLGMLAQPVLSWNHRKVMEWGREGLEKRLAEAKK